MAIENDVIRLDGSKPRKPPRRGRNLFLIVFGTIILLIAGTIAVVATSPPAPPPVKKKVQKEKPLPLPPITAMEQDYNLSLPSSSSGLTLVSARVDGLDENKATLVLTARVRNSYANQLANKASWAIKTEGGPIRRPSKTGIMKLPGGITRVRARFTAPSKTFIDTQIQLKSGKDEIVTLLSTTTVGRNE